MPTYLGIDASLEGTGLCLVSESGDVSQLLTVDPQGAKGAARLAVVKRDVSSCLSPDVAFVAMEGYAYQGVGRVFELGEVGGVIKLLLHEHGISMIVVPPINLKKFATGSTGASKMTMLIAARAAGARPTDDNQADAFFLARVALACHAGKYGARRRSQMEVIHRLKNPLAKKARRRPRRLVPNPI